MKKDDFIIVDSNNIVIAMSVDDKVMTKSGYRFIEKQDDTPFMLQEQNGTLFFDEK